MAIGAALREALGLLRSFVVYWRPGRQRGLRRLYAPMVGPGDLVFDVGAHLGDRTVAFASLGARVVALEPQPRVARWLRRVVGRSGRVTVREAAVGRTPGTARLAVSRAHPTVSTLAGAWREALPRNNPSFRGVRWDDAVEVPVVTLDGLIAEHGLPRFCKLDIEGWEAEALAGLSRAVPGVSVEFVAGGVDVAEACVRRLKTLGDYRFNAVLGEGRRFVFPTWVEAEAMVTWLRGGAGGASSGDVYARLEEGAR